MYFKKKTNGLINVTEEYKGTICTQDHTHTHTHTQIHTHSRNTTTHAHNKPSQVVG